MKNFKPQTRAPKGALCACGDSLGPHFLAADGGSVPQQSAAPWAPKPGFTDPTWSAVWEAIKAQGPDAVKAWLRKQAEYMANRAAPYYGGQRGVNGAANLKEQLDMLAGTARGATAATLGLPGDLQSLGRAAMSVPQGPLATLSALQEHTVFPKSDELKRGERGFLARGAGTPGEAAGETLGDFVPLIPPSAVRSGARAVGRGVEAVGRKVERGVERALEDPGIIGDITRATGRTFAAPPARAVKPKGGNFDPKSLDAWLEDLGVYPEPGPDGMVPVRWLPEGPMRAQPVQSWGRKQLANYVRKDLGAPTDPLLAVERELPDLHFPEGKFAVGTWGHDDARRVNEHIAALKANPDEPGVRSVMRKLAKQHLELTPEPMTPWGLESGRVIDSDPVGLHLFNELTESWPMPAAVPSQGAARMRSGDDILKGLVGDTDAVIANTSGPRHQKFIEFRKKVDDALANDWRAKKPNDPMYMMSAAGNDELLGFDHVLDYLEAGITPYTRAKSHARMMLGPNASEEALQSKAQDVLRFLDNGERSVFDPNEEARWRALHGAGLTLDPASLPRLSVADAVRKTAQWNKFMADQGVADGPLTKGWKVHKEYPGDAGKGMRWVEFGKPEGGTLPDGYEVTPMSNGNGFRVAQKGSDNWGHVGATPEEAIQKFHSEQVREGLGAEGDAMGHCVGGYCDDVLTRGTKIYSLRDAKGKPHVTIEVRPGRVNDAYLMNTLDPDYKPRGAFDPPTQTLHERVQRERRGGGDYESYALELVKRLGLEMPPPEIIQIKGKGNAAPIEEYLPFVQDFVRSGKWGRVGDLRNAGLRKYGDVFGAAELEKLVKEGKLPPDVSADGYTTLDEVLKLTDPADHDIHRAAWAPLRDVRYARGGPVRNEGPDPEGFLPRTLDETVDYALRVFGRQ